MITTHQIAARSPFKAPDNFRVWASNGAPPLTINHREEGEFGDGATVVISPQLKTAGA